MILDSVVHFTRCYLLDAQCSGAGEEPKMAFSHHSSLDYFSYYHLLVLFVFLLLPCFLMLTLQITVSLLLFNMIFCLMELVFFSYKLTGELLDCCWLDSPQPVHIGEKMRQESRGAYPHVVTSQVIVRQVGINPLLM